MVVLGPTHDGPRGPVLARRQNARLALVLRRPGAGPVGAIARLLVLCVTI